MKTLIYVLLFAVCVFCSCEKESHPILPESEKNIQFYDYSFDLSFDKLPEKSGTYTFNVVMKFTDKELKTTVSMQF